MNKNLFLFISLHCFMMSSSYFPQKTQIEKFQYEIDHIIAGQEFNDSIMRNLCEPHILLLVTAMWSWCLVEALRGNLCGPDIRPFVTGVLFAGLFATITKICECFSYNATGTFPVKKAGFLGFIAGYAPVAIAQFFVLKRCGIK